MSKSKQAQGVEQAAQDEYAAEDLAAQAEVQAKYEAEALAVEPEPGAETAGIPEGMPERFYTGGATFEERQAWIAEHGEPIG